MVIYVAIFAIDGFHRSMKVLMKKFLGREKTRFTNKSTSKRKKVQIFWLKILILMLTYKFQTKISYGFFLNNINFFCYLLFYISSFCVFQLKWHKF